MNSVITGGCGFVGSNLAAYLMEKGEKVTLFDSLARHGASANLSWLRSQGEVAFIHGDIRNLSDVDTLIRNLKPDVIFHLAGQVAMTTSMQNPRGDFEINVLGSINVLEAVRQHCPHAGIVYASSNKVYGNLSHLDLVEGPTRYHPKNNQLGVDETAAIEFHTPYGCSKGAADQYMLDYARGFGLNTIVFRHSTIYGGRQFATYDQGWVGWFCRQALESMADPDREPFTISGDGKQVRDLLHVSDAVRCYVAAFDHIQPARGEAFNIGGGIDNSMSLLELFQMLEAKLGTTLKYRRLPWRQSDQKFFVADNRKVERLLDWSPKVTRDEGINSVIDWERSQRS
jgi:CDP-paratose 2-epimerase